MAKWIRSGGKWSRMPSSGGSGYCNECGRYKTLYRGGVCAACSAPEGQKANTGFGTGYCAACQRVNTIAWANMLCEDCNLIAAYEAPTSNGSGRECSVCHQRFQVLTAGGTCFRDSSRFA